MAYKYNDRELKQIMKGFQVIVDTREKSNLGILKYFSDNNIDYVIETMKTADYSSKIKAIPELGIMRDLYLPALVERKANYDEICSNLQKSTQTAFINEMIRAQGSPFVMVIEDLQGYAKLVSGQYRSNYKPETLIARLNSLKARYGFEILHTDSRYTGHFIYHHLYYHALEYLKKGLF